MRNNRVRFTRGHFYTRLIENFGNWKQILKCVTTTDEMTLLGEREIRETVSLVQCNLPSRVDVANHKEHRECIENRIRLKIWKREDRPLDIIGMEKSSHKGQSRWKARGESRDRQRQFLAEEVFKKYIRVILKVQTRTRLKAQSTLITRLLFNKTMKISTWPSFNFLKHGPSVFSFLQDW